MVLVVLVVAVVTVLHFAGFVIALYDTVAGSDGAGRPVRLTGAGLAAATRDFLIELVGAIVCVLATPLGWIPWRSVPRLAPGARPPVVLVPGWGAGRMCFAVLRRRLRRDGWPHVVGFRYRSLGGDMERTVRALRAAIERTGERSGAPAVILVAHGLGGIVCRAYLRRFADDARVAKVLTLGTAHRGSALYALAPDAMLQELRPNAPFLIDLGTDDPIPGRVDFTAVYAGFDHLIVPASQAYYPGVGNIEVEGVGHVSLLWSARVYELVRENLEWSAPPRAEPDAHTGTH
jgi:triacylglycerol esterase/lipase EstA (alpha/beta hydrolase family)